MLESLAIALLWMATLLACLTLRARLLDVLVVCLCDRGGPVAMMFDVMALVLLFVVLGGALPFAAHPGCFNQPAVTVEVMSLHVVSPDGLSLRRRLTRRSATAPSGPGSVSAASARVTGESGGLVGIAAHGASNMDRAKRRPLGRVAVRSASLGIVLPTLPSSGLKWICFATVFEIWRCWCDQPVSWKALLQTEPCSTLRITVPTAIAMSSAVGSRSRSLNLSAAIMSSSAL